MTSFFVRQGVAVRNDLNRSLGALVGIAQGLVCDAQLNDVEIGFLNAWLSANESISHTWPGDIIRERVRCVLADGLITEDERDYLLATLNKLVGGTLEQLEKAAHVSDLMFDAPPSICFSMRSFCLTGDFVFGPRECCIQAIERRGGSVLSGVTRKLDYLVVGSLGSIEWKHGSFGTKVEKALALKRDGYGIFLVQEDHWTKALARFAI
ncbi:MAG: NAD-dependent DNA ligase [Burkholderiales bacterium]|nr:MAG: NAD-dependent DNA ligase [Burkholderiales bacterium]